MMLYVTPKLVKAKPSTLFDGALMTDKAVGLVTKYAQAWVNGARDLELERQFPDLSEEFYVVRADREFARRYGIAEPPKKPAVYVSG